MLGKQAIFILTKENKEGYKHGYINEEFIRENITDFNKHFYVCGPDKMVIDLTKTLENSGVKTDTLIFEK